MGRGRREGNLTFLGQIFLCNILAEKLTDWHDLLVSMANVLQIYFLVCYSMLRHVMYSIALKHSIAVLHSHHLKIDRVFSHD